MFPQVRWGGVLLWTVSAVMVLASKEVMRDLTINFTKALEVCKKEMNLGDHIMQDFYNFWKEDYPLVNNELGCAIMCLANKLDLITEDMSVHHEKTHAFATKHGADDDVARHIVQILHECEKLAKDFKDECTKTLEISKCFRTRIHALQWAPTMEVVLEEVMTDIK